MDSITKNVLVIAYVAITLFFICIFGIIIHKVRNKQSAITNEKENDFISVFIHNKTAKLEAIPGGISFKIYMAMAIITPILLFTGLFFVFHNGLISCFAIIGVLTPEVLIKFTADKNKKEFEERYARALKQISSSLTAGMSIQQAVADICKNPFIHETVKKEFIQINSDIQCGISIPEAFKKSAEKLQTSDSADVAAAIKMQSSVGGEESAVIESIANNISSRIMLRREIKSLFASVTMTAYSMEVIPVIVMIMMFTSAGGLMDAFFESIPMTLLLVAIIGFMCIGTVVIQKMITKAKRGL